VTLTPSRDLLAGEWLRARKRATEASEKDFGRVSQKMPCGDGDRLGSRYQSAAIVLRLVNRTDSGSCRRLAAEFAHHRSSRRTTAVFTELPIIPPEGLADVLPILLLSDRK
jgi:hypothetical protein